MVPPGGGLGRVMKIDKLPVNLTMDAYYNVVRPDLAAPWQLRTQMTFIF